MTPLLRRAVTSAGLAVCGWSTLLLAQSTTVVIPDRTQIRRALPVPPAEAPPVVQQSPSEMGVRVDRDATYQAGSNMTLSAQSNVQLKGNGTAEMSGSGGASVTGLRVIVGSCSNAKPAARLGDQVNTATGPNAVIAQGSPTVLIC